MYGSKNRFIFFDDLTSSRIKNRNWNGRGKNLRTGEYEDAVFAEVVLREYFLYGRNYQPKEDLRMEVDRALQFNFGIELNDIPIDWGNTTEHTRTLEIYKKLRAEPYDPSKTSTDPWDVYWRSDPKRNDINQFFVVTQNQVTNMCAGGFSCVSAKP